MNYPDHYKRLIEKRENERPLGYTESHHIHPTCQGGPDISENKVCLTAKEHLIAHLLLVKMYPGNSKLLHAASMMSYFKKYGSRKYDWLKKKFSLMMSERIISEETRKKIGQANSIRIVSDETRKKMSGSQKGKSKSEEHVKKMAEAQTGKNPSAESRDKMSRSAKERKKIMGSLVIGDIHGDFGKLSKFLSYKPEMEHIILGDVCDSFSKSDEDIMLCIRKIFSTPKVKYIMGNHDVHYFLRPPFKCSGFRGTLELVYKPELTFMAHRNRIYAALERDGVLLTHAGVHDELAECDSPTKEAAWLNGQLRRWLDDRSASSPIFHISKSRGGYHSFPGIFWLDHRFDQGLSKKYFQVFGHSAASEPYVCPAYVCLDTTNHPGVWVYDTATRKLEDINNFTPVRGVIK